MESVGRRRAAGPANFAEPCWQRSNAGGLRFSGTARERRCAGRASANGPGSLGLPAGFFPYQRRELRYLGTASFLALSMFLTFAAVFLWLVLAAYAVIVRKSPRSFVAVAVPVVLGYVLLGYFAHFSWIEAFSIATARENPGGFSLFS